MEKTEVLPTGLTLRLLVIVIATGPLAFCLNTVFEALGTWWIWPAVWPLPMIYNLVIFRLLEKISPKFRFSSQEICLTAVAFMIVSGGGAYLQCGIPYWPTTSLPTANFYYFVYAQWADPYKGKVVGLIPSYLAPADPAVIRAFYLGGAFDWGSWFTPIAFWTVYAIALYGGSYFWSFLLRKPYVEVEKLPYTGVMPVLTTMGYYFKEEGSSVKRALFDLSNIITKVFWIGFIVAVIASLPSTIGSFLPIPREFYIADIIINLTPLTYRILPGADTYLRIVIPEIMIGQFAPMDILLTTVSFMFVFNFIINPIQVALGLVPYTPLTSEQGRQYWYTVGPFKWLWWANVGIPFGLGVYALWHFRQHFIDAFKVAFGLDKDLPKEEEGLSYRTAIFGGLVSFIVVIVLWTMGGMPPAVSVLAIALYLVVNFGWIKCHAFNPTHGGLSNMNDWRGVVYDFGRVTGNWGSPADPNALGGMMMWSATGPGAHRMSGYSMIWHHMSYKMAKDLKTPARSVVIVSLITIIGTSVFGYAFWTWFIQRMGGWTRIRFLDYTTGNTGAWWNYIYGTPPLTYVDTIPYMLTGTIAIFVIYFLRARFAWFFINPVGFLFAYHWDPLLIALVIKYLSLKIGGVRWFEKYNVPFAAGFAMGYGASVFATAIYIFFARVIPELLMRLAV